MSQLQLTRKFAQFMGQNHYKVDVAAGWRTEVDLSQLEFLLSGLPKKGLIVLESPKPQAPNVQSALAANLWDFPKSRVPFWGPYNKDYNISASILRSQVWETTISLLPDRRPVNILQIRNNGHVFFLRHCTRTILDYKRTLCPPFRDH